MTEQAKYAYAPILIIQVTEQEHRALEALGGQSSDSLEQAEWNKHFREIVGDDAAREMRSHVEAYGDDSIRVVVRAGRVHDAPIKYRTILLPTDVNWTEVGAEGLALLVRAAEGDRIPVPPLDAERHGLSIEGNALLVDPPPLMVHEALRERMLVTRTRAPSLASLASMMALAAGPPPPLYHRGRRYDRGTYPEYKPPLVADPEAQQARAEHARREMGIFAMESTLGVAEGRLKRPKAISAARRKLQRLKREYFACDRALASETAWNLHGADGVFNDFCKAVST